MLLVLSDPGSVQKEALYINQLFDAGLSVFHLRKPESSVEDLTRLLQEINPEHHPKIALHQQHGLANEWGIVRLHYNETSRMQMTEEMLTAFKLQNKVLSTSIHDRADYEQLSSCFDYTFLGPVFDSLSKTNYKAMSPEKRMVAPRKKETKIIALGGIYAGNCTLPFEWGFDGIALLGALWIDPRFLMDQFKTIQAACATTVH